MTSFWDNDNGPAASDDENVQRTELSWKTCLSRRWEVAANEFIYVRPFMNVATFPLHRQALCIVLVSLSCDQTEAGTIVEVKSGS